MTEPGNQKSDTVSCEGLDETLQAIEDTIRNGSIPDDLAISADDEVRQRLKTILENIVATQRFSLAIAEGDLSQSLTIQGKMAGSLKTLQSNLRHLTWQAGQIANGDFSQRVNFMGDFSNSFNLMVERLSEDKINRVQREEELENLNASLTQANKKISMLSSITRHDIKNKLLVLRGYLGLVRVKLTDPEQIRLIEEGDRAAETIGNQIEFTKYYEELGIKAPEWQDITQLILAARSQVSIPDTVEVLVDLPAKKILADALIEKVFYNLMDNTLRHGGDVSRIRFFFSENDDGAEIIYEDNGTGISSEDKSHLFQKGFGKNTGLGLFLSREILAITGLTISEVGEPGKGVRFVIAVPKGAYR
jgi:signal transduction histidine kinase